MHSGRFSLLLLWAGCLVAFLSFGFSLISDLHGMDLDADPNMRPRAFKGFRKRWQSSHPSVPSESGPLSEQHDADEQYASDLPLFGFDALGSTEFFNLDDPDEIEPQLGPQRETADSDVQQVLDGSTQSQGNPQSCLHVLDPNKRELSWKAIAHHHELKRAKQDIGKLPWELEGSAFPGADRWQGTALASFDSLFASSIVGASDVCESQVVQTRPATVLSETVLPVIPMTLRRARKEPVDEDIRLQALLKFKDIILQDPLATQLGTSLKGRMHQGSDHDEIHQSFRDCFRMKASSTLQKRAASLMKLTKFLRAGGQLNPLRLSEPQLYAALCNMRSEGLGATSAQHVIEALHFLHATAKLRIVDLTDVISARCRGVARDMYLLKSPLQQKLPLTVEQVRRLEVAMQSSGPVLQCILGQVLFCIHACCRWRDSQRLKSISTEVGGGETLVYADALQSKTTLTAEAKTRFLPFVAIGTGIVAYDWAALWLDARHTEGLGFSDFALPSFSEKFACWLDTPMSSSEATMWIREFLDGTTGFRPEMIGSHSCKTTLLTWAGRSVGVVFSPSDRRLLGHHLDPNMKSVMCYSRECYTSLYSKVLSMFRLIRSGEFDPDQSAIARVVQMADGPAQSQNGAPGMVDGPEDPTVVSDSDSSVASLDSGHDDLDERPEPDERCVSLFPAFPGVPEASLFVHKISGLVHVANEDDFLICGRPTSCHFRAYAKVGDREHLVGCRQCLKSFQNRKV